MEKEILVWRWGSKEFEGFASEEEFERILDVVLDNIDPTFVYTLAVDNTDTGIELTVDSNLFHIPPEISIEDGVHGANEFIAQHHVADFIGEKLVEDRKRKYQYKIAKYKTE